MSTEQFVFESLLNNSEDCSLIVDHLMVMDARMNAQNDSFFPFEEKIQNLLTAFNRDSRILNELVLNKTSFLEPPMLITMNGNSVNFPPSGVIPFKGISLFAAFCCYLSSDDCIAYQYFFKLYSKYFSKLNCFSGQNQCILYLCDLFENLLLEVDIDLVKFMISLGVFPLKIAFSWIFYGFLNYLAMDQIFVLWDRIIAFDSLDFLPLMAVAIFVFRKDSILKCTCEDEIYELFQDGSLLLVMPLLQSLLFKTSS
ncbi:hypothetical protein GEMRC1_007993 [Eukaryota sp. GEM-RC1]